MGIGNNFTGTGNASSLITPADSNGAIGPKHFVEFINGTFAVYNKTNGQSVKRITDKHFWSDAHVVLSTDAAIADPRIIYDPVAQRWFASQVDFDGTVDDPTFESNDFLFAVSATADPTGAWNGFLLTADPDTGYFADFPTLGVDRDAVYLSGDMYFGMNNPVGAALLSFPKADLLGGVPTITNRTWFGVMSYSSRGQVLQPVTCFDGSSTGAVVATGDLVSSSDLKVFNVLGGGATNASLSASTTIAVTPYAAPPNPTQPDGSDTLDDNDARFSARTFAINGVIYGVHNVDVSGRAAIRWYRIRASNHVLLEAGTIADPDLDLFFPSIGVNAAGIIVVSCNGCSLNTVISCYAVVGETVNGTTTFGGLILLKTGADVYHDLYEQFGLTDDSRWGDYSAVSVDPVDSNRFWLIGMAPADDSTWATQITELLTAPLQLTIAPAGTNALVSWPALASSYQLQSTTNLLGNLWSAVPQTPFTNGAQLSVLVPDSTGQQFFRLASGP